MRRVRKIVSKIGNQNYLYSVVGQDVYDGFVIDCIVENEDKFDVFIIKDGAVQFWKDFYKKHIVSTEDYIVE